MKKTEQYIIKRSNKFFDNLTIWCKLSKNLYNSALYNIRQHYFVSNSYKNFYSVTNEFTKDRNVDYCKLPAKVSQQTIMDVDRNFKSFFALLKLKLSGKYNKNVKIPKYLDKDGMFQCTFTKQALSFKTPGFISLSKLPGTSKEDQIHIKISNNINKDNVCQLKIIPKSNYFIISIIYETCDNALKENNNRYCSIDLGLNNLMTIGSNVIKPVIINGKPLKSINQYYNKQIAHYKSKLKGNQKWSNRLSTITFKRNMKVKDYLHKSSRIVINHLVSNNINTLVIGHNKEWKQEINIGSRNNQNFVNIPHSTLINMLKYKCQENGINVICNEESYTSKCSFIDNESIKKHDTYCGKRIKRGLFKSASGKVINADLNGALNILKKAVDGLFDYSDKKSIEAIIVSPIRLRIN